MIRVRRRPRLIGVLAALTLALAPALPNIGIGAQAATAPARGYWFVAGDGGIFSFGDAKFAGSTGSLKLNQPIVGMAPTPSGKGYWFVAADGGIFSFGDAKFYGSTGSLKLNRPIVGMAPTPSGRGYWFVAADGGIFSFGDAAFYGSTGATRLSKPIIGMAATPTGKGYWFVASDGGIFNYGDAAFHGAGPDKNLKSPVVAMTSTPSGKGYLLATADGTVVPFGDAIFRGAMGGTPLKSPIVGIAPTMTGLGYWLVAADGGIFSFGDAAFQGSTGSLKLNRAIVGMAASPLSVAGGTGGGTTNPTNPGGGGTTNPTNPGGGGGDPTDPPIPPVNPDVDWGAAGTTSILARAARGGGGTAFRPWMNGDGRYLVFDSDATGVMGPPDGIATRDVYLYDRVSGAMERISTGANGVRANVPTNNCGGDGQPRCGSQRPTISSDGRFIAFWSNATNLVANDTNNTFDAFLFDRQTKTMSLVSKGFNNAPANGESRRPVVSRDGAWVAFESAASNIVAPEVCKPGGFLGLGKVCTGGDKNNADDVFRYDVASGAVSLVSAGPAGAEGGATANGASNRPSLSGNGRRIAYQSSATNLVPSDPNGAVIDVFVTDVGSGQTGLISFGANGPGDKNSTSPAISSDGRWVSFDSKATNFASGDTGGDTDIYIKDLQTGTIEQVSVQTGGGQGTPPSGEGVVGSDSSISGDGRFVAFWGLAANLAPNDNNGVGDVYVRDRVAGTTKRITSTNGIEGDGDSLSPAISVDGRFLAFDSKANALDPTGGSASGQDIFVHVNR